MSSEKPLPPQPKEAHRQADIYDLLAWFEVNRKKVLIAALALVIVGFAIATMRYMREQKELNASSRLLAMRISLNQPTNTAPVQPAELQKIAQEFGGTGAAERARLLAATAFFTEGKYAEAEREFSAFAKDFPGSAWVSTAAYGVATAQEAQNKQAEAVASYQNVVTAHPNSPVADDAKLALARIYEARKQPDQALRLYNELLVPPPGAQPGEPVHPEAAARKEALLRNHPELSTNMAPAVSVTQPINTPQANSGTPTLTVPTAPSTPAETSSSATNDSTKN